MKTVSVILPVYNSEATVKSTLQSILAQEGASDEFKLEIIVVDDCSTDNTMAIVKSMNIPVYSTGKHSGGPNKGRNIGLERASGDFITFIDHDDTWNSNKIKMQLEVAQYFPIVTTGYLVKDLQTNQEFRRSTGQFEYVKAYKRNQSFLTILKLENHNAQSAYLSSIMISKELKQIRFEEKYGMLTYDWLLRLFENQRSVEVGIPLFTRYINNKNLSLSKQYRENEYRLFMATLKQYKSKYPSEVDQANTQRRMNGIMGRYYYLMGEMKEARKYLKVSSIGLADMLFLLTSFYGSVWVKRNFPVLVGTF